MDRHAAIPGLAHTVGGYYSTYAAGEHTIKYLCWTNNYAKLEGDKWKQKHFNSHPQMWFWFLTVPEDVILYQIQEKLPSLGAYSCPLLLPHQYKYYSYPGISYPEYYYPGSWLSTFNTPFPLDPEGTLLQ